AKLLYDAANRVDRDGAFVEMMRDGSGRAIAAAARGGEVAIAITGPADPAPFPLLVMIGVLGLGATLAAAGAVRSAAGGHRVGPGGALIGGRAARLGMFAGVAALAVPVLLWQSWVAASAIALIGATVALAQRAGLTDRFALGLARHRTAAGFLAPAAIAM